MCGIVCILNVHLCYKSYCASVFAACALVASGRIFGNTRSITRNMWVEKSSTILQTGTYAAECHGIVCTECAPTLQAVLCKSFAACAQL